MDPKNESLPPPSRTDSKFPPKQQQDDLLAALPPEALKLFRWVRDREQRQDWGRDQNRVGAPSPKKRIADFVRTELLPEESVETGK